MMACSMQLELASAKHQPVVPEGGLCDRTGKAIGGCLQSTFHLIPKSFGPQRQRRHHQQQHQHQHQHQMNPWTPSSLCLSYLRPDLYLWFSC